MPSCFFVAQRARTIDHLHVTAVENQSPSVVGSRGVCHTPKHVSSRRQAMSCGILMKRKISNEPLTKGLRTRLQRKNSGRHRDVLLDKTQGFCLTYWVKPTGFCPWAHLRAELGGDLPLTPEQLEWFVLLTVFLSEKPQVPSSITLRIPPLSSWQIKETPVTGTLGRTCIVHF